MKKIRNEEIDRNAEELFDGEEFDDDLLDDNATWKLTPKACLEIAINDTDISDVNFFLDDEKSRKFESVYAILEKRMNDAGYITDENGETKDNTDSDKPIVIFEKTIRGFYPLATDEQISAAWDLFVYHMERQGNISKRD
ncbi:MAG: hypothetical protein IJ067_09875 [Prevotella sp.]|nr:hypothetical protein [Prevotella sp.]